MAGDLKIMPMTRRGYFVQYRRSAALSCVVETAGRRLKRSNRVALIAPLMTASAALLIATLVLEFRAGLPRVTVPCTFDSTSGRAFDPGLPSYECVAESRWQLASSSDVPF